MEINGIQIDDTFAEAFTMQATRLLITACNRHWVSLATHSMIGFANSAKICGCEAGIEQELSPLETPDSRPGFSVLILAQNNEILTQQVQRRVAQCILTTATTACFSGIDSKRKLALGNALCHFGDGWQISKRINNKRYWRIPVTEGEFICEETAGIIPAVSGGNFFILAESLSQALFAAEKAVEAIQSLPNIILPFPGGIIRSGFKLSSKYKQVISTNHLYCPTLKEQVNTLLDTQTNAVLQIMISGLTSQDVIQAMRVGIQAVGLLGRQQGIIRISAGNYGGQAGTFHFALQEILA